MDTKGPTDATVTSSEVPSPTSPTQKEPMTSKCQHITLTPILPTTLRSSSTSSHLPIVMVPELVIPKYDLPE